MFKLTISNSFSQDDHISMENNEMKRHILLSIKPKYVKEITVGEKKFEFRKKFPDLNELNISRRVIIYCSKPTMKIIGSFEIKTLHHADFDTLMNNISAEENYRNRISGYFKNKKSCYALEISNFKMYKNQLSLEYLRKEYRGFVPGQSYRYLDSNIVKKIENLNK